MMRNEEYVCNRKILDKVIKELLVERIISIDDLDKVTKEFLFELYIEYKKKKKEEILAITTGILTSKSQDLYKELVNGINR